MNWWHSIQKPYYPEWIDRLGLYNTPTASLQWGKTQECVHICVYMWVCVCVCAYPYVCVWMFCSWKHALSKSVTFPTVSVVVSVVNKLMAQLSEAVFLQRKNIYRQKLESNPIPESNIFEAVETVTLFGLKVHGMTKIFAWNVTKWSFFFIIVSLKVRELLPMVAQCLCPYICACGGARGVIVIVARIGHGDTSSNPGLIAFHIALMPLGKVWIQLFSLQLWVNSRAD